jgi:hypothetical protein
MSCPNCGSYNCDSNKIEIVPFENIARTVYGAHKAGQPAMAVGSLMLWGGLHVINRMRKQYSCCVCGQKF